MKASVKAAEDPNCAEPVCHSKVESLKAAFSRGETAIKRAMTGKVEPLKANLECPADREELGQNTWTLLHTMAAYYPEKPSAIYQEKCRQFMDALAHMYPCRHCATDFQDNLEKYPPKVETRKDLSLWLCDQHNLVNEKIRKPKFKCTLEALDERWKTGDSRCWENSDKDKAQESLGQDD